MFFFLLISLFDALYFEALEIFDASSMKTSFDKTFMLIIIPNAYWIELFRVFVE